MTDFSWLCPNVGLSCWQKFHLWYQPRGLFSNPRCIVEKAEGCFRFGHLCVSSELFMKKKMAFGESFHRGRKKRSRGDHDDEGAADDVESDEAEAENNEDG